MFILSKLLWLFVKPFNVFLFTLMTGAILTAWTQGRWRRVGQWFVGIACAAMVVLNVLPLGSWALGHLETRFPTLRSLPVHVDGIIILSGVFNASLSETHGSASLNSAADRLWAGLELAHRYNEARVVFTGGNGLVTTDVPAEADLAEKAYRSVGLSGPRVIYERKARNTRENAIFSKDLVKPSANDVWLLVTSASHMPRAAGSFEAIGWHVTPYPVDHVTGGAADPVVNFSMTRQFGRLNRFIHEWLGLIYYYARGWTNALYPAPDQSPG